MVELEPNSALRPSRSGRTALRVKSASAEFENQVKPVQQRLAADRTALKDAEKFATWREEAWERVASIIDETRNPVEAWPSLGEEGRKALLDYSVYNVKMVVEPWG